MSTQSNVKNTKKEKVELIQWAAKLRLDEHDELLEYGKILKEKGMIDNICPYSITQYALRSLLRTMKQKFGN